MVRGGAVAGGEGAPTGILSGELRAFREGALHSSVDSTPGDHDVKIARVVPGARMIKPVIDAPALPWIEHPGERGGLAQFGPARTVFLSSSYDLRAAAKEFRAGVAYRRAWP